MDISLEGTTMNVRLTDENETFLKEVVRTGHFGSDDEAINEAIRLLRRESSTDAENTSLSAKLSPKEWSARLRKWALSHVPVAHAVDDSRESIYAGRGE